MAANLLSRSGSGRRPHGSPSLILKHLLNLFASHVHLPWGESTSDGGSHEREPWGCSLEKAHRGHWCTPLGKHPSWLNTLIRQSCGLAGGVATYRREKIIGRFLLLQPSSLTWVFHQGDPRLPRPVSSPHVVIYNTEKSIFSSTLLVWRHKCFLCLSAPTLVLMGTAPNRAA